MKILKFGGSSIESIEKIKNVGAIIIRSLEMNPAIAVVVSAFGGVTDELIGMSAAAAKGDATFEQQFNQLETRHLNIVKAGISISRQSHVLANIKILFNELEDVLHGVLLVKERTPKTLDFILSFGERLSAYTITEILRESKPEVEFLDARLLIKTDDNFAAAKVNDEITNRNITEYFANHPSLQIITGFIGSTKNEETTTLGRGGSDYTASIFGAALQAQEIEIWTDVDGVMTADPRKVPAAFSITSITYEEAMEMSHFGAKVIYPPTIRPALSRHIPIRIKNSLNPDFAGTLISETAESNHYIVKGISSIEKISLLRLQGSGLIGAAGIAARLFGVLGHEKINIILITQASSEHSICFAVESKHASKAKKNLEKEFALEIQTHYVDKIIVESDLAIVAIVGENMRKTPGISAKLFQALGNHGVNVNAIAQGSSELNISVVIHETDETRALNAIHDTFFFSPLKRLNLFVVGTGLIGSTLLQQLHQQSQTLRQKHAIDLRVQGIANIENMILDEKGISLANWTKKITDSHISTNIADFISRMKSLKSGECVFVDCTASEAIARLYEEILNTKISIVTPNKIANSMEYDYYCRLQTAARQKGVKYCYEATVGAGLPVIVTLKNLIASGDQIIRIEAVLSGSLSFIFNSFKNTINFSELVQQAMKQGFTEPDPSIDLSGLDVARKTLILAREIGMAINLHDVALESILPPQLQATSGTAFLQRLPDYDGYFRNKLHHAESSQKVLRYIATIEGNKASAGLQEVDNKNPFYHLAGNDNMMVITTARYCQTPLVIQGPGAGAEVTAGGVFADILQILS